MSDIINKLNLSNYEDFSKEDLINIINILKDKNSMQESFMLNISHDLRNPINVILSILQCIDALGDQSQNIDKKLEYRGLIKRNSLKMIKLIDNLIDSTKIEGNYYNFNKKNIDVINLIESTISSTDKYAKQKDIQIVFDTNVDECIMSIEPQSLDRVVMNLLSNAIKFSPIGEQILINTIVNENLLEISVKDNGVGIVKEEQKKIFNRFVQASKQKESFNCGSGIGLDLVNNITNALGGSINLKSEEGKGAEFIVSLPIVLEENKEVCRDFIKRDNVQMLEIEFSDIYL